MKHQLNQILIAISLTLTAASNAHAHGDEARAGKRAISTEKMAFGSEGHPGKTSRTLHIDMSDKMRFSPAQLTVQRGETVRFIVKNSGKVMHEMVLGTMQALKEHAELMKRHPGMEHDEAYMAHVKPGATEQMVWQFTQSGEFYFGCLIPGHFEAGMMGKIIVR